ncbi:4Fe-4S binding protein [Sporomusa sp.]|uniref:4Fe-4S binding protein n=1 Tax=Sporomusa sp. TaxID=2078658 RepID=UPI002BCDDCF5|nr:4Fe-4S binding protein [Sporomusa sp.]HWR41547.1 4Fe-4S binding protein [Sporomusa sp.]
MLAPILIAPFKGRYWCGNYCPRGSLYDNILSKFSPNKPIPAFRTPGFRTFMVALIMSVFGIQMYYAWGNLDEMV